MYTNVKLMEDAMEFNVQHHCFCERVKKYAVSQEIFIVERFYDEIWKTLEEFFPINEKTTCVVVRVAAAY